jgi:hypothetical protein
MARALFAVEDRFARDLADLLTEEASMLTNGRNIDLSACRAKHGRALTGRSPRRFQASDLDRTDQKQSQP